MRGADWLYNYFLRLLSGRQAADRLEQPRVSRTSRMPHVLWELSGVNRLVETEYEDTRRRRPRRSAPRASRDRAGHGRQVRRADARADTPGTHDAARVQRAGRRPRQLPGLHGRAGAEQANQRSASPCCCSSACCSFRVLAEARILEGRALAIARGAASAEFRQSLRLEAFLPKLQDARAARIREETATT